MPPPPFKDFNLTNKTRSEEQKALLAKVAEPKLSVCLKIM